jgi:uncharacterized protein
MTQMNKKLSAVIKKYQTHPEFLGIDITDPNQPGAVDDTLLHLAARKGDIESIQSLIECGAQVDSIGDLGNTPLHQAAMMDQLDSVKKLLAMGANPNIQNEFGQTVLDVAELGDKHNIVNFLDKNKKAMRKSS